MIIVGAGIGGLAVASGLRAAGWQVTVLEQAPEITEVGAGLSLWPNALQALEALGLDQPVRAAGVPAVSRGTFRDPDGTFLRRVRRDDIGVHVVHRADLLRILQDAATDDVVRVDARVTSLVETAEGVHVTYRSAAGEQELTADLVVGADGLNSVVRQGIWPEAVPRFRRRTVWRGLTDTLETPVGEGSITLSPDAQFGLMPMPGGGCYWFLTADEQQPDLRYPDELAEVRRRVGDWHQPIPEVLAATEAGAAMHHDIFDLDPLPTFVRGRRVLIGDAAHAMTPELGQGACQALEDAAALTRLISDDPDLAAALAGYDDLRRPRAQQIAAVSRQNSDRSERSGTLAVGITRLVLRLAPPEVWRRTVGKWVEPAI